MFYQYDQNNSCGIFKVDDEMGIGVKVIIEEDNAVQANNKAEYVGLYFNGVNDGIDCQCCGDRWVYCSEEDAILIENDSLTGYILEPSFIHYKDGTIKKITSTNNTV